MILKIAQRWLLYTGAGVVLLGAFDAPAAEVPGSGDGWGHTPLGHRLPSLLLCVAALALAVIGLGLWLAAGAGPVPFGTVASWAGAGLLSIASVSAIAAELRRERRNAP